MQGVADLLPLFVVLALVAFGAAMALAEGKYGAKAKSWSDFDSK